MSVFAKFRHGTCSDRHDSIDIVAKLAYSMRDNSYVEYDHFLELDVLRTNLDAQHLKLAKIPYG